MPSTFHYSIHGLVLASNDQLPLPRLAPLPADISYRVDLGARRPTVADHSREDDPDDPYAIERWTEGRLTVEFPEWATFELRMAEIVLVADDAGDADLIAHLLLDQVMPRIVALRGDLMLHASGVVGPSGHGHVFIGETGAGKSTIATALAMRGWLLLDDDGIRITESGGVFRAVPGTPDVRLLPDTAAHLLPGMVPGAPSSRGSMKRRYAADGHQLCTASAPAPLAGIYLLERSETASIEPLGLADALGAIAAHGFHVATDPKGIARHVFEQASAIAGANPVWRLRHPEGLDNLGATARLVEEVDERS